jgi:hypothetical protein
MAGIVNLSLNDLFFDAFGYRTTVFDFKPVPGQKLYSDLGSPYFKKDVFGRDYYMPVTLNGHDLPYPVISVEMKKTTVETALAGRRGTVKEMISTDDYVFVVRGLIVSADNSYPESEVRNLRALFELQKPLPISSPITDLMLVTADRKGYDKVVITRMTFPEVRGIQNVRPYEMTLVSDEPFSLIEQ